MPRSDYLPKLLARFGLAGGINTGFGLTIILVLDLAGGVNSHVASAFGYLAGLAVSFALNRTFVFRSERRASQAATPFILAAAACFALSQGVLAVGLIVFGHGDPARFGVQLASVASYSIAFFLLCRIWVFPGAAAPR